MRTRSPLSRAIRTTRTRAARPATVGRRAGTMSGYWARTRESRSKSSTAAPVSPPTAGQRKARITSRSCSVSSAASQTRLGARATSASSSASRPCAENFGERVSSRAGSHSSLAAPRVSATTRSSFRKARPARLPSSETSGRSGTRTGPARPACCSRRSAELSRRVGPADAAGRGSWPDAGVHRLLAAVRRDRESRPPRPRAGCGPAAS